MYVLILSQSSFSVYSSLLATLRGYFTYQHYVVLGLDEVNRLIRTLTDELGACGLTTQPFLDIDSLLHVL
jgi:hypothetical protein